MDTGSMGSFFRTSPGILASLARNPVDGRHAAPYQALIEQTAPILSLQEYVRRTTSGPHFLGVSGHEYSVCV
jgi:hypothetical protein